MNVLDIITVEQLKALKTAGFVVIHDQPDDDMRKAFYAKQWPELVEFDQGFHRVIATSIRRQNREIQAALEEKA